MLLHPRHGGPQLSFASNAPVPPFPPPTYTPLPASDTASMFTLIRSRLFLFHTYVQQSTSPFATNANHASSTKCGIKVAHKTAILNKEYSNTAHNYAYLFEAAHPWSIVKVGRQPLSFLPRPRCHPYNKWLCTNIVTGLTYVGDKLVISYSESDANPKFYVSSVDAVFADMDNVLDPVVTARPPSTLKVNRFPDEDPDGPVDGWLQHITIPPMTDVTPKVALVCVWNGKTLPAWMDYFVLSASYAADKGCCCCDMCTANVTAD